MHVRLSIGTGAVLAVAALLSGCSSVESDAQGSGASGQFDGCETPASVDFVRPFEVDPDLYPFDSCAYETGSGVLHYVDAGPKDAEHTVLMVHGNPTWSFLYRNIAQALVEDGHRVVIPDHLGMGMSDVPSTAEFDYRPRTHSAHLEDLVIALDLHDVTLVVQDWGGPIGLGMATRQPDRIGSILIMNTWAWSVDHDAPGDYHGLTAWYDQAKSFGTMVPDFFCRIALPGQAEIMATEVDPSFGALFEAVRDAYVAPAIDPGSGAYKYAEPCAPMQIFAESIVDDNAYQGEVEAGLSALEGKPYSLLFGLSDIIFGAQRCDLNASAPCPGASTCVCDEELLPHRVDPDCSRAPAEYHVCVEPGGEVREPFADGFVARLGEDTLVSRESIPAADHMVQEDAPERVVAAIRALIAAP